MFNPKISIIIPVYNWANYLAQAINSALDQTYKNIEVLVINDGSTDNGLTEQVALSFWDKVRYLYKENWWVATALNFWIEKSTWEYTSWLSHDDLYYPNKIEEQVSFLSNISQGQEKVIVFNDFELIDAQWIVTKKIKSPITRSDIFLWLITNNFVLNGCTLLLPKTLFLDVWFFDASLKTTQDYNMWIRALKWWYHFFNLPKVLTKYRIHNGQGSIEKKELFYSEIKKSHEYILSIFSPDEMRVCSGLNLNECVISLYVKLILRKHELIWSITLWTQKIWLYKLIAPIYRKLFIH